MNNNFIDKHLNSHTERSADDNNAVDSIRYFLKSNGKFNCNFNANDKWPNIDGNFELVPNPDISKKPFQNFFVQIKGTNIIDIDSQGCFDYRLQDLAFPAYALKEVTSDPCILFVVINTRDKNRERVFWKYMSYDLLNAIDYSKKSYLLKFEPKDEIVNSEEGLYDFVKKLVTITERHSFVKKLDNNSLEISDIKKIVLKSNEEITDIIEEISLLGKSRDAVSRKLIGRLNDLCSAALLLNAVNKGYPYPTLRLAWDISLLDKQTKFMSKFLRGIEYIGKRVPDDGQSERLMLKYYDYMWQIRKFVLEKFKISILENLEKFPTNTDKQDEEYYNSIYQLIDKFSNEPAGFNKSRYTIIKKTPFFIGKNRYFEITLQLSDMYASKFNRITVYTKEDIVSPYSIQISYNEASVKILDEPSYIKIVSSWRVSIDPAILNKVASIVGIETKLSANYGEYSSLMDFLTTTGMDLLDLIDLKEDNFNIVLQRIYNLKNTSQYKPVLQYLRKNYNAGSSTFGKNTMRYVLSALKEKIIYDVAEGAEENPLKNCVAKISKSNFAFEKNPILYNLPNSKSSNSKVFSSVFRAVGLNKYNNMMPFVILKDRSENTGEIYIDKYILGEDCDYLVSEYNQALEDYDLKANNAIKCQEDLIYIESYEKDTIDILRTLKTYTDTGIAGQQQLNNKFIKDYNLEEDCDLMKVSAIRNIFTNSRLLLIYGAAGTGKTMLINYISTLMDGRSKLFMAKTHTAKQNLESRIKNPGINSKFIGIDQFKKSKDRTIYDVVFIDECSTIDNRTMKEVLSKISKESLIVLAGDIFQIESIEFGNWFYYAKDIIRHDSMVELDSTWRTKKKNLINLWDEVRYKKDRVTEVLAMDGPFSEDITKNILKDNNDDTIVLCLNYDGRFGLNNINSYFQDANKKSDYYKWHEWKYKIGDRILFNESKRFPCLYNNLKGKIVGIEKDKDSIIFSIEVERVLTYFDVKNLDFISVDYLDETTIVKFAVYENNGGSTEEERDLSKQRSIVPFQIAYAVSIHKSQGLEYDNVKIVIPSNGASQITHGIFYTAITRARQNLKIYWSSETMKEVVSNILTEESSNKSLDIIKKKL